MILYLKFSLGRKQKINFKLKRSKRPFRINYHFSLVKPLLWEIVFGIVPNKWISSPSIKPKLIN